MRLWVNHKLVIDHWTSHTASVEDAGTIALTAATKTDIQLEYYNNKGAASVQLWWSSPSQVKSVVPTARLYPAAQNLRSKIDHAFSFPQSYMHRHGLESWEGFLRDFEENYPTHRMSIKDQLTRHDAEREGDEAVHARPPPD